jgi:hypothetical protein
MISNGNIITLFVTKGAFTNVLIINANYEIIYTNCVGRFFGISPVLFPAND